MKTYQISFIALLVRAAIVAALAGVFLVACVTSNDPEAVRIGLVIVIPFVIIGLFPLIVRQSFELQVHDHKVEIVTRMFRKKTETIDGYELQSVGVQQGPIAERLNYGQVILVRHNGKKIDGGVFDDPKAVVEAIRPIIPRHS